MPRPYALEPTFFLAPCPLTPFMHISFRLPYESRDPIYPASSLQLSFALPPTTTISSTTSSPSQEIFLPTHLTAADVAFTDDGLCSIKLPRDKIPYPCPDHIHKGPPPPPSTNNKKSGGRVVVKLHAWKGETHLGAFEVGRLLVERE